jgi:UDP-N-acetylmuramate: L-alanyl-gamma-D-glutamyl-meso-diaminopimelate ligase
MKKIHFIGIAGKAIAPIAKMMQDLGWKVTGSDINVFEPMPTLLNKNGIEWYEGFDPNRVHNVDKVLIGGSMLMKDKNNPEFLEAIKLGHKPVGYEALIRDFVLKENSIVVAGTYGKSTTSAIMIWILKEAGINPSFMTGGQPVNYESGVESTNSEYSVLEGDEFVSVWGYDMTPRFHYYNPKYAILTATQWDHVNIYPTEQEYIDSFKKFAKILVKQNGFLVSALNGVNNDLIREYVNTLGGVNYTYCVSNSNMNSVADFTAEITGFNDIYTQFTVKYKTEVIGEFETELIGQHNIENCLSTIALSYLLKIDMRKVESAIKSFKGLKVHLELVGKNANGAKIYTDLAHSAVKAKATLEALRERYKDESITVVFDPHASSLSDKKSLEWYPGAFDQADEVIIPQVSVKKSTPKDERVYGIDIVKSIKSTQPNTYYIPIDENIVKYLTEKDSDTIIIFMSGGGWREIVNQTIGR